LGIETTAAPVRAVADIERMISTIAAAPSGGLIVQPDGYTGTNRRRIIELAARYRLPAAPFSWAGNFQSPPLLFLTAYPRNVAFADPLD
jgi:hypothetical protein